MRSAFVVLSLGLSLGLLVSSRAAAKPGDVVWLKQFGGKGLHYGWGLAVAPGGDILLGGYGDSPIDLGGGVLLPKARDGIFVAAFDAGGKPRWSRRFAIELPFYAGPMGTTRDGKALLAGDFGDWIVLDKRRTVSEQTAYLARIDAQHVDAWIAPGSVLGVVGLADGGVAVAGKGSDGGFVARFDASFKSRWRVAVPESGISVAAAGETVIASGPDVVLKIDAAGKVVWRHALGAASRPLLAVDRQGNTVVALANPPATKLAVTQLGPDGEPRWTVPLASYNVGGIAVDAAGNVAVSCDEGIVKLGPDGTRLWTQPLGQPLELTPRSVAFDAKGRVLATGWFTGSLTLAGRAVRAVGDDDVFLLCLEP